MPRLSTTGKAVTGIGNNVLGIDGATPAALVGYLGGGWSWRTTNLVVGAAQPTPTSAHQMYEYSVSGASVSLLDPSGANDSAAGGGEWALWLAGYGLDTSIPVPGTPLPLAGLYDMSEAGLLCLCPNRSIAGGVQVYDPTGASVLSISTTVLSGGVRCRNGVVCYQDVAGWHLVSVTTGQSVSGFAPRQNILSMIPFQVGTRIWIAEYDRTTDLWSLRPANGGQGWIVQTGGLAFNVDAVSLTSSSVRMAWSLTSGEAPSDLILLDVNLVTGTTIRWTVVAGVLVSGPGPTLQAAKFGSALVSALIPPIPHNVVERNGLMTNEWQAWARAVANAAASAISAVNNVPTPSPPGTPGSPTGLIFSAASLLLGRGSTAGGGPGQEISLGSGLGMAGTVLTASAASSGAVVVMSEMDGDAADMTVVPGPPGPAGAIGATGPAGPAGGPMGPPGVDGEDAELLIIPGPAGATGATGGGTATASTAFGSEPGSPSTGDLDLYTNAPLIARYSGSAWPNWGPIYPFTAPVDGDFAWVNQGSASVSTTNGGIYLLGPVSASNNIRIRKKSAPSTPYTITAAITVTLLGVNFQNAGVCFRQSSDGKLHTFGLTTSASTPYYQLAGVKWNSPTSFSAIYTLIPFAICASVLWVRLADDGSNRVCSVSMDGQHWLVIHTVGRTDFLTADEVGFFVDDQTNTYAPSLALWSWAQA